MRAADTQRLILWLWAMKRDASHAMRVSKYMKSQSQV